MHRDKERYGQDPTKVHRSSDKTFYQAPKWKDPMRILTCSWSDFFIKEADKWRDEAWGIIRDTPQHTWMILTKRPERIADNLPSDWGDGWDNVWLGVTTENQEMYDKRVEYFSGFKAKVKFLSMEPLLGPIKMSHYFDQIIIGGESGNHTGKYIARKCDVAWIKYIISGSYSMRNKVFLKQLGTYLAKSMNLNDRHGRDINEFPECIKIREMII